MKNMQMPQIAHLISPTASVEVKRGSGKRTERTQNWGKARAGNYWELFNCLFVQIEISVAPTAHRGFRKKKEKICDLDA